MSRLGEFGIIERWFTRPVADAACRVGIGDDAAIVEVKGPLAIAVDMLVEGTHFPAGFSARSVGHRALAVNLSDLAAVGARPRWATLALSLPAADEDWLDRFAAGFFALADRYDVALIGGDTTRGPLTITVEVIGDITDRPLLRSDGRAGDHLFVTGTLGDSGAALEILAGELDATPGAAAPLIERFSYPEPRTAIGQLLAGFAHAAIDISDGLVADLGHLCEQSGCGALIEPRDLPLSRALLALCTRDRAEAFALNGGDDYELCFAVAPEDAGRVFDCAGTAGTAVTEIGRLTPEPGLRAVTDDQTVELEAAGFRHF